MHAFVPVNKQGNFNQTERNTSDMCQFPGFLEFITDKNRKQQSFPLRIHSVFSFYLRLKICEIPSREDFLSRKYF